MGIRLNDIDEATWDVTIAPRQGLLDLGLEDLWRFRDLVRLLAYRNYMVNYRQTVLGPLWYVVQPLMTTAIFTMVFKFIGALPTDGIPAVLFYLSGIVVWSNFATNLMSTSDVFVANIGLFGKVYFPRLTVPIATVLTNLIALVVHLALFLLMYLLWILWGAEARPSLWMICCPLLFGVNIAMALGVGLSVSALTTRYRDLASMLGSVVQLWMYASPLFYPLSQIPERWRLLMALNPVSTMIEIFRYMAFGKGTFSAYSIEISLMVVVFTFASGLLLFRRAELIAADTV
ncbi:ABC transporter permease [Bradyrhizobium sp. BR 10261]|nr:ABC transporter permease [Bradyrhizobium sp. BR 10261]